MSAQDGAQRLTQTAEMAQHLADFTPRPSQIDMAQAVAKAIDDNQKLVIEAGTGTGKTLAYLLPALASGKRVIISTATRYLQQQLAEKDLPLAEQLLGQQVHSAVLKGRSNYLCLYRLDQAEKKGDIIHHSRLRQVREWSRQTQTGDLGELGDLGVDASFWHKVTSTADNCLGRHCPFYEQCWVYNARQKAQAADVVIINHHLLFADLALRDQGFGDLLPDADVMILDEAHRLAEIAGRFFGTRLSARQIKQLIRDSQIEHENVGADMPQLAQALRELEQAEQALADGFNIQQHTSVLWQQAASKPAQKAHAQLAQALAEAKKHLAAAQQRSEVFKALVQRFEDYGQKLEQMAEQQGDSVGWVERTSYHGWTWHSTPLNVAEPFSQATQNYPGSWIFTSATLAVDDSLKFFTTQMGLEDAEQCILPSPFDFKNHAQLFVPERMPSQNSDHYLDAVAEMAFELVKAAQGGAFLLCTSYKALRHYAQYFEQQGQQPLVQGRGARHKLLETFRSQPNQILIGTSSFWEGVDVKGSALRLVIIDKLPFASPTDPVINARKQNLEQHGENGFMKLALPQAAITLKQGVGRLIRDAQDYGLLTICDPRLYTKGYGKKLRRSLPDMPITRSLEQACEFLEHLEHAA